MLINKLEQLKLYTTVVADTGDFRVLKALKPQDCTTNPSLILKAALLPDFNDLVNKAIASTQSIVGADRVDHIAEALAVAIGVEALKLIPGRISTEVDSSLSFDTQKTVAAAQRIIKLYQKAGVAKERVLIKVAATWEGILACKVLEESGINTNVTLVFNLVQAVAAAKAGAWLISPFVGRILDWHQQKTGQIFAPLEDPGVICVSNIYHYFKQHDYKTIVMAASFRSQGEIEALAGCDRMTIAPVLLEGLAVDKGKLNQALPAANTAIIKAIDTSESAFRWALNEDAMATEKLAEGIRMFNQDTHKLKVFILSKI